jgi:hypothetical protein
MKSLGGEPLSRIFAQSPETVAELLSSKYLASGGPAAGLRMLTVYIAYTGRRLSPSQRQSLHRAKELLLERVRHAWANRQ